MKHTRRLKHLLSMFAIAAFLLSSHAFGQYALTGERVVNLEVGDIYFQIEGMERGEALTVQPGELITFVVHNVGGMPHNVQFGRELDPQARRYQTELYPGFAGIDLNAGQSARITLQMPSESGEWEIGCLILGHYEAGQRISLIVTP